MIPIECDDDDVVKILWKQVKVFLYLQMAQIITISMSERWTHMLDNQSIIFLTTVSNLSQKKIPPACIIFLHFLLKCERENQFHFELRKMPLNFHYIWVTKFLWGFNAHSQNIPTPPTHHSSSNLSLINK